MSQTSKRDADNAFGEGMSGIEPNLSSKKGRKRRRRDPKPAEEKESVAILSPSNVKKARSIPEVAEVNPTHRSTTEKTESQRDAGIVPINGEQPNNPKVKEELVTEKSRSKRNKRQEHDQDASYVEPTLSNTDKVPKNQQLVSQGSIMSEQIAHKSPSKRSKRGKDKSHRKELQEESRTKRHDKYWAIGPATGGAFIEHDPILTSDEKHLILATKHNILVYSTKTSLLVRTLHIDRKSNVVTYAQISNQEQFLVVGLKNGTLVKIDWTTGKTVWSTDFNGCIRSIVSTSASPISDGFLMVNDVDDGTCTMSSLALDENGKQLGRRSMLQQKGILRHVCSSPAYGITVVCSRDTIHVGRLSQVDADEEAALTWHEISVVGKINCFDAQILPPNRQSGKSSGPPIVNVAVGLSYGEINLFNDVLNSSDKVQATNQPSRRLHWHRFAPRSIKFSPDSNYLISGGDETVLVIWQLDTNQKQTLPHLTTAILDITVSQNGSAYAVHLADNSVMVISTSDLQPYANVSSLGFDTSSQTPFTAGFSHPAALHPNHPGRLLLAYSLQNQNTRIKPADKSANMLQTYDLASHIQLGRQALARDLVSSGRIGPGGQILHEPEVTHLDISHDGKWLVSIDQWVPEESDLQELYLSRGDQSDRDQLNECFLRFWSTSTGGSEGNVDTWELNTRIDDAVSSDRQSYGHQLQALATNPVRLMVATADSKRVVKLWSPKARMRSGVPINDAKGNQLYTWTCDHEIILQESSALSASKSVTLAFSEDGSVLAASWATTVVSAKPRVYLIDTKSGTAAASLPDILTSSRSHLKFRGQYLIGLSHKFCVYDTVTMRTLWAIDVAEKFDHGKSKLAVNSRSGIVAVVMSEREVRNASRFLLIDVQAAEKKIVLDSSIPLQVQILLADNNSGGFILIDGEGRTRTVSPPGALIKPIALNDKSSGTVMVKNSLENVFGSGRKEEQIALSEGGGDVQQLSLENVFRYESTARAPDVKELFNQVAMAVASTAA